MSTDWSVVCDRCEVYMHLGQRMGVRGSFGYGKDDRKGQQAAADFIDRHLDYKHDLRIVIDDSDSLDGYVEV